MDNDNAPMGEPLSEADRLAEIQARLDAVVPAGPWEVFDNGGTTNIVGEGGDPYVTHIGNSSWPGTEEMAMFIANSPADIKFLLGLVRVLEGQLATASEELERQRWYGEQLQMSIEWCSGNHEDIEPEEPEALDLGHEFLPVNGHPDDDECTHRADGTDDTYCGETKAVHSRALGLDRGGSEAETRTTAPDTAMDEFEAADDISRRWE